MIRIGQESPHHNPRLVETARQGIFIAAIQRILQHNPLMFPIEALMRSFFNEQSNHFPGQETPEEIVILMKAEEY